MLNRVCFSIPKESWGSFKQEILTTQFEGAPLLKRFRPEENTEYAVFYCESNGDADVAISKMPIGGAAIMVDKLYRLIEGGF